MKPSIITTIAATILLGTALTGNAQQVEDAIIKANPMWGRYEQKPLIERYHTQQQSDIANRNKPMKRLPAKLLTEDIMSWTDGVTLYATVPSDDTPFSVELVSEEPEGKKYYEMKLSAGKMSLKQPKGATATIEQVGDWTLLVVRNAQGKAIDVLFADEQNSFRNTKWAVFRDAHAIYDGLYVSNHGEQALFGLHQPFYNSDEYYIADPGMFYMYPQKSGKYTDVLAFGEGRINHGDPSVKVEMPGAGGAGAIMGPIYWRVAPTKDGTTVWVRHDEKFVDHYPTFSHTMFNLTLQQSPYADLPGKWAVASVRPLSVAMLDRFPKSALLLMRKEIFARHGDTFKDPDIQAYFDQQPWYRKSSQPVVLTDIERLNNQLIQAVEATKPDNRLNEIHYKYSGMRREPYSDITLKRKEDNPQKATLSFYGPLGEQSVEVTATWLDELDAIVKDEKLSNLAVSYSTTMEGMLDGYSWEFKADYEEETITSSGRNAGPDDTKGLNRVNEYLVEKCRLSDPKNQQQ